MPRPALTWVTTDTHFYHDAMWQKWGIRSHGFEREIVKWWKHYIRPYDTLIHLGDVIFCRYTELKSILDLVPCRKILTMGNHDRKTKSWYSRNGFDFVCDGFRQDDWYFRHHPEPGPPGCRVMHGHLHEKEGYGYPYYLVSLERLKYKPLNLAGVTR